MKNPKYKPLIIDSIAKIFAELTLPQIHNALEYTQENSEVCPVLAKRLPSLDDIQGVEPTYTSDTLYAIAGVINELALDLLKSKMDYLKNNYSSERSLLTLNQVIALKYEKPVVFDNAMATWRDCFNVSSQLTDEIPPFNPQPIIEAFKNVLNITLEATLKDSGYTFTRIDLAVVKAIPNLEDKRKLLNFISQSLSHHPAYLVRLFVFEMVHFCLAPVGYAEYTVEQGMEKALQFLAKRFAGIEKTIELFEQKGGNVFYQVNKDDDTISLFSVDTLYELTPDLPF